MISQDQWARELENRRARIWTKVLARDCQALLIFADREHAEPFRYLTNFAPVLGDMWALMTGPRSLVCVLNFHWELREAEQASGLPGWQGLFEPGPFVLDRITQARPQRLAVLGLDRLPWAFGQALTQSRPGLELVDLGDDFGGMRRLKSPLEISLLRESAAIVDQALSEVRSCLKPGLTELEISARIMDVFNRRGAEPAFRPGVMAGNDEDTAVIVRSPRPRPLEKGDSVMIDIGAALSGYQSDVSRTFVLGRPNKLQERIWEVLNSVMEAVLDLARPGTACSRLHETAERMINRAGFELIHRVGHGVGLATSFEWPSLDKETAPLRPGMTLALEPAIYEVGAGAMKIEDMVLITEDGCELLSQSPYQLEV
jgi:Xaa-Pro aminopeptidase